MKKALFLGLVVLADAGIGNPAWSVKATKLAEKLLSSNAKTRAKAVEEFNKLPPDAQYKLVPDFMVALSDDNPEVRKIAARILNAMGVKAEAAVTDVKKSTAALKASELPAGPNAADLKDIQAQHLDTKKPGAAPNPAELPTGPDAADLKEMQAQKGNAHYDDLKEQLDEEKKQVTLDASDVRYDGTASSGHFSPVIDSLNDPDPWVHSQAARRLAMVHPAPVQVIPTLITMLHDKDPESRGAAAAALGSMGPLAHQAIPALSELLADPDPGVSAIAADALKQIQPAP